MLRPRLIAFVAFFLLPSACGKGPDKKPRPTSSATASTRPLDHLAPGELRPGTAQVFGLELPDGMVVRGQFADVGYAHGNVAPEALANFVRERVVVAHVEIGAARTVFPYARIVKGPKERFFQIEVIAGNQGTELVATDVTPRPKAPAELSTEERWRRAGRRPDGKPLDITELK